MKRKEGRNGIETDVLPLTSLTPDRYAKPAHKGQGGEGGRIYIWSLGHLSLNKRERDLSVKRQLGAPTHRPVYIH